MPVLSHLLTGFVERLMTARHTLLAALTVIATSSAIAAPAINPKLVEPNPSDIVHIQTTEGKVLLTMSEADLLALPSQSFSTETPWHAGPHTFKGPLFRSILEKAKVPQTATLEVQALNNFVTDFPVNDAFKYDVILTTHIDGKRITKRDKGPTFIMYPLSKNKELNTGMYYNRSAWQIKRIIVK